jgi:hypothetical protein
MSAISMTCELKDDTIVVNGDLKISFRRTVRVPNTQVSNCLPLNLGAFSLKPVSQHSKNLPPGMVTKGGVFFPMYRKSSERLLTIFSVGLMDMLQNPRLCGSSSVLFTKMCCHI